MDDRTFRAFLATLALIAVVSALDAASDSFKIDPGLFIAIGGIFAAAAGAISRRNGKNGRNGQ